MNENTFVLCPETEAEEISIENPKCNIIPYKGENVVEYVNAFVDFLGCDSKYIADHGVLNDNEMIFQESLYSVLKNEGIDLSKLEDNHYTSYDCFVEHILRGIYKTRAIYERVKQQNLPANEIDVTLYRQGEFSNMKKHAMKIGLDFKATKKKLQKELIPLGISTLQLDDLSHERRVQENFIIEKFLGSDISQQYEDNMAITNIKRINCIIGKMQKEKLSYEYAQYFLKYAISHLREDLGKKGDLYKEEIEEDGIDWKEHVQELNKLLMPLGLSYYDFREKNDVSLLLETIQDEFAIQDILMQNGLKDNQEQGDILLRNLWRKKQIDEIIQRKYKEYLTTDEVGSIPYYMEYSNKLAYYISRRINIEYRRYVEEQGYNWGEYSVLLQQGLVEIGMNLEDFFNFYSEMEGKDLKEEEKQKILQKVQDSNQSKMQKIVDKKLDEATEIKNWEDEIGYTTEQLLNQGFTESEIEDLYTKFDDQTGQKLDRKSRVQQAIKNKNLGKQTTIESLVCNALEDEPVINEEVCNADMMERNQRHMEKMKEGDEVSLND